MMSNRGGYRDGSGRKPGYESTLRKTGYETKVARVPKHWEVADIFEGLEYLAGLIDQFEDDINQAAERSKAGKASNRYWKLAEAVDELKAIFPTSFFTSGRWQSLNEERLAQMNDEVMRRLNRKRNRLRDRVNQNGDSDHPNKPR